MFTASALGHLPLDYRSDSSFKESEDDERSVSIVSEVDASEVDSSDEEGAHLPQAVHLPRSGGGFEQRPH